MRKEFNKLLEGDPGATSRKGVEVDGADFVLTVIGQIGSRVPFWGRSCFDVVIGDELFEEGFC